MQTLPLGIGLLVFAPFAAFVLLLIGENGENIVTLFFCLILILLLIFSGLVIIKRNIFKKDSPPDLITKVFQNIYVVSFLSASYVILGLWLVFSSLTQSEAFIAIYAGFAILPMGVAQCIILFKYFNKKNIPSDNVLNKEHSSTASALKITIVTTVVVLVAILGGNYLFHEILYRLNPLPEPSIPEGNEPMIPPQIVSIAVEAVGCQSLTCIVATKENIPTQVISFGPSDKIQPSTPYDVFVCTPNCGTGTSLEGWNRKQCVSNKEGTLTLNIHGGICY